MCETREEWLQNVTGHMAGWYADLGYPLPKVRIAIGFPSTGRRGRRIGECWDQGASADSTFEIYIRPDLAEPEEVAAVLGHELVHAAVGLECGHKGPFRKVAVAIRLEGKMTATVAGPAFLAAVAPILAAVGPLPHARLALGQSSGPKKQKARLLKAECQHQECGYNVRVTKKWVMDIGAPHCPAHGEMAVDGLDDDEEEENGGDE